MNFKSLLEKYKTGSVTPEEKLFVEAELEKNEAINEYLSAELMDALPSADSVERAFDSKAEAKKIRKRINRKFILTVVVSVVIVAALACVTVFAVFPMINGLYYDPTGGYKADDFMPGLTAMAIDTSVYSEIHLRGFETPFVYITPRGFGEYDLTMYQYDSFRNYAEKVIPTRLIRGEWERGTIYNGNTDFFEGFGLYWVQEQYRDYTDFQDYIGTIHDAAISELPLLPKSAQVKAYLIFNGLMDMEALRQFVDDCLPRVLWAGVKCSEWDFVIGDTRFGFSPMGKCYPLFKDSLNSYSGYDSELYPYLELDDTQPQGGINRIDYTKLTSEAYEKHFIAMLEYMDSRRDFMWLFRYTPEYYVEALEYVRTNGVWCGSVVVSGTRDEIIALAENPLVKYIALDDVMVSEFSHR